MSSAILLITRLTPRGKLRSVVVVIVVVVVVVVVMVVVMMAEG